MVLTTSDIMGMVAAAPGLSSLDRKGLRDGSAAAAPNEISNQPVVSTAKPQVAYPDRGGRSRGHPPSPKGTCGRNDSVVHTKCNEG